MTKSEVESQIPAFSPTGSPLTPKQLPRRLPNVATAPRRRRAQSEVPTMRAATVPRQRVRSVAPKRTVKPKAANANPKPKPKAKLKRERLQERAAPLTLLFVFPYQPLPPVDYATAYRQHLRSQSLFDDAAFPPALAFPVRTLWRRPPQIVANPLFFDGPPSRHDIKQTALGDCFFLAPLSLVADRFDLMKRVVPTKQTFTPKDYAGIFHFTFWRYGEWADVVIDDRLPVNAQGKLQLTHSRQLNVFWVPLMEKAFAKLYGGYMNIHGGHAAYAMQNLTGGISVFNLWSNTQNADHMAKAFDKMKVEFEMGVLLCAKSRGRTSPRQPTVDLGIMPNHAYAVTHVRHLETTSGTKRMVRVRNPWGQIEWIGAWSKVSPLWGTVRDQRTRQEMFEREINGEFWMEWSDFTRYFKNVDRCYLGPEVMAESLEGEHSPKSAFDYAHANGEWNALRSTSGGGYPKGVLRGIFHRNPQFIVTLSRSGRSTPDDKGRLLVIWQIVQKWTREKGLADLFMGCVVFPLIPDHAERQRRFGLDFFQQYLPANKIQYSMLTSQRKKYRPGSYLFVPYCHRAATIGFFLMRVYANGHLKIRQLE